MSETPTAFLYAIRLQARLCVEFGSIFSAAVLDRIGDDIEAGGPYGALAETWADLDVRGLMGEAVPLRILGALHWLVLTGAESALAAIYPGESGEGDATALAALLVSALNAHREVFARFMASPPQTNEVRRSLCLVGGFLTVAKRTGLPLRCLEIGASAGLNMNWDRFHYTFGDHGCWGNPASPLHLEGEWTGAAPPIDAAVTVVEKRACDQAPIDVHDDGQALRLEAYVWPDQPDRMARLRAAIALARETGVAVDKADAADWVRANFTPRAGVTTVLYHSVFWSYLPQATAESVTAHIESCGDSATADAPVAWLRMEMGDSSGLVDVRLNVWPGGEETLLARVHPHGAKVSWAVD
jgi:hypothetical protein